MNSIEYNQDFGYLERLLNELTYDIAPSLEGGSCYQNKIETPTYIHIEYDDISIENNNSADEINYCAFYSNCKFKFNQIKSGYRICLIYNLVLSNKRTTVGLSSSSIPSLFNYKQFQDNKIKSIEKLVNIEIEINNLIKEKDEPSNLIYVFEEYYESSDLYFENLVNNDKIVGDCLLQIAKRPINGLNIFLANLKIKEIVHGTIDYNGDFEPHDHEIEDQSWDSITNQYDTKINNKCGVFGFEDILPFGVLDGLKPYKKMVTHYKKEDKQIRHYEVSALIIEKQTDLSLLLEQLKFQKSKSIFEKKRENQLIKQIKRIRNKITGELNNNNNNNVQDNYEIDENDDTSLDNLKTASIIIKHIKEVSPYDEPFPINLINKYTPSFKEYIINKIKE